jgi:hypothetical protein
LYVLVVDSAREEHVGKMGKKGTHMLVRARARRPADGDVSALARRAAGGVRAAEPSPPPANLSGKVHRRTEHANPIHPYVGVSSRVRCFWYFATRLVLTCQVT